MPAYAYLYSCRYLAYISGPLTDKGNQRILCKEGSRVQFFHPLRYRPTTH